MAYVPVNFELNDFQLSLNTAQSAKFHKRLKELGFDSHQDKDTLIYTRGKSRITAFVVGGAALNFLPDFYDDTPGGTVYAIMEKMCMAFGGTMVGRYSIDGVQNHWDVRISQGMNLSGKADVGKRDHVVDENASGHLAPSSRPQSTGGQTAKKTSAPAQLAGNSGGQVEEGLKGESSRDKLYRELVEGNYKKHVEAKGEEDPEYFLRLVKHFNTKFPKEKEQETWTEEEEAIRNALCTHIGLPLDTSDNVLSREISLLVNNEEDPAMNVADDLDAAIEDVESVIDRLAGGN